MLVALPRLLDATSGDMTAGRRSSSPSPSVNYLVVPHIIWTGTSASVEFIWHGYNYNLADKSNSVLKISILLSIWIMHLQIQSIRVKEGATSLSASLVVIL